MKVNCAGLFMVNGTKVKTSCHLYQKKYEILHASTNAQAWIPTDAHVPPSPIQLRFQRNPAQSSPVTFQPTFGSTSHHLHTSHYPAAQSSLSKETHANPSKSLSLTSQPQSCSRLVKLSHHPQVWIERDKSVHICGKSPTLGYKNVSHNLLSGPPTSILTAARTETNPGRRRDRGRPVWEKRTAH